jgi:cell division protein FtsI (penicillin-binding protein 3)
MPAAPTRRRPTDEAPKLRRVESASTRKPRRAKPAETPKARRVKPAETPKARRVKPAETPKGRRAKPESMKVRRASVAARTKARRATANAVDENKVVRLLTTGGGPAARRRPAAEQPLRRISPERSTRRAPDPSPPKRRRAGAPVARDSRARGAGGTNRPRSPRPVTLRVRKPVRPARSGRRLVAVLIAVVVLFVGIVARLFDLQAVSSKKYATLGLEQRVHTVSLPAERGSIFDRNGEDLALSAPAQTIYADPRVMTDTAAAAAKLAPVLHVDEAQLAKQLAVPKTAFVYLTRQTTQAEADAVKKLNIPGVSSYEESKRYYPSGSIAASVLGLTGVDGAGLNGVEYAFDKALTGTTGKLVTENDPRGREIPNSTHEYNAPKRGQDLVLTLDAAVQYETEQYLLQGVARAKAQGGTAVVMDIKTGDVLAMATVDGAIVSGNGANGTTTPAHVAGATEQNRPVTAVYEPGSTMKVVTISGALQDNKITTAQTFTVPDSKRIDGKTFTDAEWHSVKIWSAADILSNSSNIGTIGIAQTLGATSFDQYLRKFGFGRRTTLALPGESGGLLLPVQNYSATSLPTMAFGSGVGVTEMQMLDVYATIANGGVGVNPRLVAATVDARGNRHNAPTVKGQRVVSKTVADEMNQMLQQVVTTGTGVSAAVAGYPVAGKTGTALIAPYAQLKYNASFAGFAPANDPQYAVMVVLDAPQDKIFGGEVAAPVFSQIMQFTLRHENVPARSILEYPPAPPTVGAGTLAPPVTTTTAPTTTTSPTVTSTKVVTSTASTKGATATTAPTTTAASTTSRPSG